MVLSMLGPRCLLACRCYPCTISKAWRSFASLRQIFSLPRIGAIQFAIFPFFFLFFSRWLWITTICASVQAPPTRRSSGGRSGFTEPLLSHLAISTLPNRGCLRLQPKRVTLPTPDTCCRQLHSALPVFRLVHLPSETGFACCPKKKNPKRKCAKGTMRNRK